jgi:hypothetical protein
VVTESDHHPCAGWIWKDWQSLCCGVAIGIIEGKCLLCRCNLPRGCGAGHIYSGSAAKVYLMFSLR